MEVQDLMAKLWAYERHITQLEGQLRGSEVVEVEKMERDSCHHWGTTNHASSVSTTTNKSPRVVAMAHTFCEFVPGALFHPPILHPTAAPPIKAVISLCTNSLLKCNEHQPPKSPNPWDSLALRHVCRTCQQNDLFCTSIYKIPACRSTFAPIANALSLAQLIPSWGLLTFWFGWGDEGIAMWVRGTCVRGSAGFEGGVVGVVSGVLLRPYRVFCCRHSHHLILAHSSCRIQLFGPFHWENEQGENMCWQA